MNIHVKSSSVQRKIEFKQTSDGQMMVINQPKTVYLLERMGTNHSFTVLYHAKGHP